MCYLYFQGNHTSYSVANVFCCLLYWCVTVRNCSMMATAAGLRTGVSALARVLGFAGFDTPLQEEVQNDYIGKVLSVEQFVL